MSSFPQHLFSSVAQGLFPERGRQPVPGSAFPEPAASWTLALWEQEAESFASSLLGRPGLLARVLQVLPEAGALAAELLKENDPGRLCGAGEEAAKAVAALKAAARPKHWTAWLKSHRAHPLLVRYRGELDPSWKKLAARLPFGKGARPEG